MTLTDILLIFVLVAVVGAIILFILKGRPKVDNTSDQSIQLLQSQIGQLTAMQNEKLDRTLKEINDRMREQNVTLNDQLHRSQVGLQQQFAMSQKAMLETNSATSKIIKEVTEKLTKLDDTNKQIVDFAGQMQSLENILKNPKQRGVLGEYYLETVLRNVLPPDSFKLQYKFSNGEIVDAIIITRDGMIPVDAKFTLGNYNRMSTAESKEERAEYEKIFLSDLKKRIDETSKYIRPGEKTFDFAFMFLPADGLYYDLLVQKIGALDASSMGVIEYAFKKKVMVVSPTTLFAYLQTVLQGLRALKIEESTIEIQKNVGKLQKHLSAYEEYFNRLGGHLEKATSSYTVAAKEFGKIDKDMFDITGKTTDLLEVAVVEPDPTEQTPLELN